jgi:hypothetical protein
MSETNISLVRLSNPMALTVTFTSIPELLIIEPEILGDEREFF